MSNSLQDRIERAKWLSNNIHHAAMATVNEDGSPHNTPYFFMKSDDFSHVHWGSHPDSIHSKNILRTGELFIVLFDAIESGGLYIQCKNGRISEGAELDEALKKHNQLRAKRGKDPLGIEYYRYPNEQRMWIAETQDFWVNLSAKDENNHIREDQRHEVAAKELL